MNYCGITNVDIANGTGCRVVLWISGCTHNCPGCHNPETHNYVFGKKFTSDTVKEICNLVNKPYIKGLTISGGDPLDRNIEDLIEIFALCKTVKEKYPEKDIWIYTGYTYEYFYIDDKDVENKKRKDICHEIFKYCDVLVDGSYKEELRDLSLPFRGSSNQRIIYLNKE
jgi:anaerobic ribonucleoside-triphosphate reductase activating protein